MFISDFAIKRPIITITAMVALVVFGIVALFNLETDEFPDVQQPVINVTIAYPGASPDTVEREIVEPIEDAIFAISGVDGKKTTSSSTDSLANFTVFFDFEKDIQEASQDIRDAISSKRADLPQEMEEPILTRFDPADQPIVSLVLTSDALDVPALTLIADPLVVGDLRSVPGVAQATVVGGVDREMTVQVRPAALQAAGLSVAQVVAALQAQNLAAPVGRLNTELQERTIRLKGRLETPEDFAQVPIAERNGRTLRLGEVADVFAGTEEPRTLSLYNGAQAVGIEVIKSKGHSTTEVADGVRERVKMLQQRLPANAKLEIVRDAGTRVENSVINVQQALIEGALLTVLVVFLFLNSWRSTVITGLALPVSVLASFVSVWAFGFTLNTMSLLGLTLAIGILIDDAIVVRENIVRHVEMGKDHYTASREGTNEIGLAVAATTFSIVAVFVPVAFMYGVAGQWFKPFALTIACSVLVSLFVSFSLDPMLSAYWPDPQVEKGERRNFISRGLERFNHWFDRQADRYKGVIAWALDHRLAMVLLAVGSLVGAVALQGVFGGAGFVPVSDRAEIEMLVETPAGSSLDYTRRKVEEVSRLTRQHPEVAYTYTTIGVPLPLRSPGVDQALVYVRLKPKTERKASQEVLGKTLRQELLAVGGANVSVFTSGFGGAIKSIQLELRGPESKGLNQLAQQVMKEVKQVPGAVDVGLSTRGEKPELEVELNRGVAGQLNVTVGQVAQSLRPAFAGLDSGDWVDPIGETRDVMVRLAPQFRENPSQLSQLPLVVGTSATGAPVVVPLGQVASVKQTVGPAQIDHLNREKVINVQANVAGRSLSEVMNGIQTRLEAVKVPPGYEVSTGGESADQQEVFGRVFLALGVAVMLMYLILVIQFGSFIDPLAILVSLPLSLIGVVLALVVTGDTLNIMSLIGVILLMGIVAKNAILLIDFAKWQHEKGMPLREALIEAGRIRLRPIIMTTFALIAGMVPVALGHGEGGDFRAPLGRAVIGGVITSTLLTLLVIPTVYEILTDGRAWMTGKLRRVFKARGQAHGPAHGGGEPRPHPQARQE
ncbi:efflux RND transporter permease subunit [Corallococcus exiguus]|uniref:AcrB/AcrD/AcrF family protein n=1 Tax=Corallococcus exiguus TaxID=83462 RepID=A0A7X5BPQ0_9BACT|nr:efflux RND transporter permease subunit [Corallococcus exiguus]NBC38534.1 AcrB/AcrD/AcrF family protein [Corallococcus exiguus]TNV64809.1 efflux RND transporter permease subunit [Corallococcus exiguus]